MHHISAEWRAPFPRYARPFPESVELSKGHLDLYAIGPGYGECIVIVVGGSVLFGVDCCNGLVSEHSATGVSMLEMVCRNCDKESIVIWALSHPHHDHFQGIGQFTEMMLPSTSSVVLPMEYSERDIRNRIVDAIKHDRRTPLVWRKRIEDEYTNFCDAIDAADVDTSAALEDVSVWETKLLRGRKKAIPFRIRVIAPSKKHHDNLTKRGIRGSGVYRHSRRVGRSYANDGSAIYVVEVGELRILLAGDAPLSVAKSALERTAGFPNTCTFLKVGHHGSSTSTDNDLLGKIWNRLSGRRAVICPFDPDELPEDDVLEILSQGRVTTKITAVPSSEEAERLRTKIAKAGARKIKRLSHVAGHTWRVRFPLDDPCKATFKRM